MSSNKRLLIVYGSQTGNSQDLAERIWRKAKQSNISTKLSSFDQLDLNELSNDNIVLLCICSTTGQGDVPDNMTKFWKFIMRKNLAQDILKNLIFFIIGLGDSSYDKFNFTAKKLYKRFLQLGGTSPIGLCLCDDQDRNGIEGAYSEWIKLFWEHFVSENGFQLKHTNVFINKYRVEYIDDNNIANVVKEDDLDDQASELKPFHSKLVKNERVTDSEHWQNVRFLEFDCNTNRINYEPGDVLVMRPSNLKTNIEKFLEVFQHLNLNLDQKIKIVSNYENEIVADNETNQNSIKTIKDLIEKYFDLNSVPRMSFFELLADLSNDETEKEKLQEFLTPEGQESLFDYCYRPRRTINEVFFDFPKTCKSIKNLDILLDLIPNIKARSFSIASSPFVHKERIQLLVAVVEYKTRLYETRKGTCSYWLSTLDVNSDIKIPIWIKKGSFKIDLKKPVICIGPGTGVAPFRSIINERIFKYNLDNNNLYFGCRSKSKDYYFEKEWLEINKSHPNYLNVYTAFSRDQAEKIYVQDLLLKNSDFVFNLINNLNCYILVAGNSKRMPQDVIANLEKIIQMNIHKLNMGEMTHQNDEEAAKYFIKYLESKKIIQLETWS